MKDPITKEHIESLGYDFKIKRVTTTEDIHPLDYCCIGKLIDGNYFFLTVDDEVIKTKEQLANYILNHKKQ